MRIEEYKKLEYKINNENFNQSYKTINMIMKILSYFGHVASIFLAYFMLSKVISGAMTDSIIAVFIASIVILGGIELLKRSIFDKFSIQYLKTKTINKEVLPLFLLSFTIIGISFYASIAGAAEFSSKSKVLDTTKKEVLTTYKDSVSNSYNTKITLLETKMENKDKEQTDLEALPATRQQKSRINDLKKDKEDIKTDIINLKLELKETLKSKENEVSSETDEKKQDNSKNSLTFVIISSLIELTILIGIFFNEYYKFRSYREFRDKIEKDPAYQKWFLYEKILSVIYTEDTKLNQKLPTNKSIIELCKVNSFLILQKDIIDLMRILDSINIIRTSGSVKYFSKTKDVALDLLRKHFNIE